MEGGGACSAVLSYRDRVYTVHQEVLHIRRIARAALTINFLRRRGNFLQVALLKSTAQDHFREGYDPLMCGVRSARIGHAIYCPGKSRIFTISLIFHCEWEQLLHHFLLKHKEVEIMSCIFCCHSCSRSQRNPSIIPPEDCNDDALIKPSSAAAPQCKAERIAITFSTYSIKGVAPMKS